MGTMRTRPWMGMPRACGAQILSRASRRPSLSTLPVVGGKSFCQMKGRCMVSTPRTSLTKWIKNMCPPSKQAFWTNSGTHRHTHVHSIWFFFNVDLTSDPGLNMSTFESEVKFNQEIHGLLTGHLPDLQQNSVCGKHFELVKINYKSHNLHQSRIQYQDEVIRHLVLGSYPRYMSTF